MLFPYIVDSHVHSDNSPDGNNSVSHICESAVEKGLTAITITDHCEVDAYLRDNYDKTVMQSCFETAKASKIFGIYMRVYCGIELGQAVHDVGTAQLILNKRSFDFVIASLHNIKGREDFYYLDYSKENVPELLEKYYDEMLKTAVWNNFDVLGHITYPLRYICGENNIEVDMTPYDKKIDEIFRIIIANGKGIEVNTSGLRQKIGKTMPDLKYVKRYRELGGEIITVGSDAHYANDVAAGIEEGLSIIYEAGFRHVNVFSHRTPIRLPLEIPENAN